MEGMTTFTSDKESLQEILKAIEAGNIQLPEFQRGWVWDDAHIRSLLASISLSYPIGAVMMLENGNPDVRFKPRPIEGVELACEMQPERFILDGQQRLTSLFQAVFFKNAAKTKDARKQEVKRWYYIDMQKALDPGIEREESIVSLSEEKLIKSFRNEVLADYSTVQSEYQHCLFPASQIFNSANWRREFNKYWQHDEQKSNLFDRFEEEIIECFKQYLVPVIKLLKNTPKVAVCQVFEKVNTGGVSLTVFELVTASFASDGFNLREDWEGKSDNRGRKTATGRKHRLHEQKVLKAVGADELLQAISLLVTYDRKKKDRNAAVSCKRADILKLTLNEYQKWSNDATEGFLKAGKFLFQEKINTSRDLPYTTQLVPLAAVLAILHERAESDSIRIKIVRWYWCGVFGELYGSAIESRSAKDVVEVLSWLDDGEEPSTIAECNFAANRLESLRTRNSAAYKGLYALLMRDGCLDFRTGEALEVRTHFGESLDIHHIFPRSWCKRNGIDARKCDSIINKTALSDRTNRIIGGNAPSSYLQKLLNENGLNARRQHEILATHVIEAEALERNEFEGFFNKRKEALLDRIERVIGKKINREIQEPEATGGADDQEPEIEEEESMA